MEEFRSKPGWLQAVVFSFFTLVLVALVLGLDALIRYLVGSLQKRKTCQLPAELLVNDESISGSVTRLAPHAARFVPKGPEEQTRLQQIMASPGFACFDLSVEGKRLPVFVDGFHKFFAPVYFFEKLSSETYGDFLRSSLRAPQVAPYIGHRSNRKKWRQQIAERRNSMSQSAKKRGF